MADAIFRNANRQNIGVRVRRCILRDHELCKPKKAHRGEGTTHMDFETRLRRYMS